MANEAFNETVSQLFKGMDHFISTKTCVGEPVVIGDTTLIPLMDVTFGVGASASKGTNKGNSGGGMGGKMYPSAVIVVKDNTTRIIDVNTNTGLEKLVDMLPELIDAIKAKKNAKNIDEDIKNEAKEEVIDKLSQ